MKKIEGKTKKGETSEGSHHKHHTKKKNSASHEAVMNAKRRKVWVAIGKKEVGRVCWIFIYNCLLVIRILTHK